ncbi:Uracil-DNA glycosylase [uncultured virus]|nr:Uracil-DNA glycosylase [uncultured virus]
MLTLNVVKEQVNQTWSIERIATERPPRTWESAFGDAKHELHDVSTILDEQERTYGMYYPLKSDVFNAFHYTPLNTVKVVILGQDPYHQSVFINGVSMPRPVGLSFSVRQEDSIPSSLQNIYTEQANTVRGFKKPDHGDLREWARQGVLLLNTCLTVRPGAPGSHGDIWLGFINKIFKAIAATNPNCIFMLWGREAQKVKPMLGERSIILEAAHPSGLSARRGFFGCNHFNLANDTLIKQGKVGINWKISTLAELRNPTPTNTFGSSPPGTAVVLPTHQPIFAPVNVDMLPTIVPLRQPPVNLDTLPNIIPLKPIISPSFPVLIGIPVAKPPELPQINQTQQVQQFPIIPNTVLPTIPNTKPIGPMSPVQVSPLGPPPMNTETAPSPVKYKAPSPKASSPTVIAHGVPTIPTIKFGANLNKSAVIPIMTGSNPTVPVNIPQFVSNKPAEYRPTQLVGIPIIPTMV